MERFVRILIARRIWLIGAIALATIPLCFFLPELKIKQNEATWFTKNDPALTAYNSFKEIFTAGETVVIAWESDSALGSAELDYLAAFSERLRAVPGVADVISLATVDDIRGTADGLDIGPLIGPPGTSSGETLRNRIRENPFFSGTLVSGDYRTLGILLEIEWNDDIAGSAPVTITKTLRKLLDRETRATGRRFYLGGNVVTDSEVQGMIERDMMRFFPLSIFLAAIALLIIFRNLTSIVFPVASVILALVWTLGMKGLFHVPITPVSTTLFALVTIIGIAGSIHLISHYRMLGGRGMDPRIALFETLYRAGTACFHTSLTTALGFGSLAISGLPIIRDMGIFAAFGIMCAFFFSMVLATVALVPFAGKQRAVRPVTTLNFDAILEATARVNLRFPRLIIILSAIITVVMIPGIPRIRVESSMLEYLKKDRLLRVDAKFLDSALTGTGVMEVLIEGQSDSFKEPEALRAIEGVQRLASRHASVSATYSIADYVKLIYRSLDGDNPESYRVPDTREAVAQSLLLYEMSGGSALDDFVTIDYDIARISLRTRQMSQRKRSALLREIEEYLALDFSGYKTTITGFDLLVHTATERIVETQIRSLGLALLTILGLMCFLFGFKGGLLSILPNIFPVIVVLGLMGFAGYTLNVATSIIASIAIGIVVDDTIHYFFHFRHEIARGCDRGRAMRNAHHNVGAALCFTSIILTLGFLVFTSSDTRILTDYGVLSSVAVMAALLGDLFLGPVLLVKSKVFEK